jgi:hypothetical protein
MLGALKHYEEKRKDSLSLRVGFVLWENALFEIDRQTTGSILQRKADLLQIGSTWVAHFAQSGRITQIRESELGERRAGGGPNGELRPRMWSDFPEASSNTCKIRGEDAYYGIPGFLDMRLLYYRKPDSVENIASREIAFRDREDFETWLGTVYKEDPGTPPFAIPRETSWELSHQLAPWVWGAGGDYVKMPRSVRGKRELVVTIGDEGWEDAMRYLSGLRNRKLLEVWEPDHEDVLTGMEPGFLSGRFNSFLSNYRFISTLQNQSQKGLLFGTGEPVPWISKVGVCLPPTTSSDDRQGMSRKRTYIGGAHYCLSRVEPAEDSNGDDALIRSSRRDEALRLARYLAFCEYIPEFADRPDKPDWFFQMANYLPAHNAARDVFFSADGFGPKEGEMARPANPTYPPEAIHAIKAAIDRGHTYPSIPEWAVDVELEVVLGDFLRLYGILSKNEGVDSIMLELKRIRSKLQQRLDPVPEAAPVLPPKLVPSLPPPPLSTIYERTLLAIIVLLLLFLLLKSPLVDPLKLFVSIRWPIMCLYLKPGRNEDFRIGETGDRKERLGEVFEEKNDVKHWARRYRSMKSVLRALYRTGRTACGAQCSCRLSLLKCYRGKRPAGKGFGCLASLTHEIDRHNVRPQGVPEFLKFLPRRLMEDQLVGYRYLEWFGRTRFTLPIIAAAAKGRTGVIRMYAADYTVVPQDDNHPTRVMDLLRFLSEYCGGRECEGCCMRSVVAILSGVHKGTQAQQQDQEAKDVYRITGHSAGAYRTEGDDIPDGFSERIRSRWTEMRNQGLCGPLGLALYDTNPSNFLVSVEANHDQCPSDDHVVRFTDYDMVSPRGYQLFDYAHLLVDVVRTLSLTDKAPNGENLCREKIVECFIDAPLVKDHMREFCAHLVAYCGYSARWLYRDKERRPANELLTEKTALEQLPDAVAILSGQTGVVTDEEKEWLSEILELSGVGCDDTTITSHS